MGFMRHTWLLQVICLVMIVVRSSVGDSNFCSNQTGGEVPSFNPVNTNTIQIFPSSPDEPSSNGTRDIMSVIKDLGVAVANLQSQQNDLARTTTTIVTQCQAHQQQQMLHRGAANESTGGEPSPSPHFGAKLEEIGAFVAKLNETIWPRLDDLVQRMAAIVAQHDQQPQTTAVTESTTREPSSVGHTLPRDCHEILQSGNQVSGVYDIQPDELSHPFSAYCDMKTDGGGWTVFQRREDGSVNFQRNWTEYRDGFGEASGEHWLGNKNLHYLSIQKTYVLRADLWAFDGDTAYAEHQEFSICGENDNYRLKIGDYVGTAGDSMRYSRDRPFSTYDADNDAHPSGNCAEMYHNGWWNKKCFGANPNGIYRFDGVSPAWDGIVWKDWKGSTTSMKKVEMKIHPKKLG